MHLCTPFSPLHIAPFQMSVLGFAWFLQLTAIFALFWGMFSMLER